ncbi:FMN-dependent NADH-azoreductase [Granulicella tundricola]|uniref:FMN dependent NADH:quinone oxidoreductase n=1 Tax=Granulicella tundricola (strain ATCC BAA-1859 / DSM 23138 / MP5ACTX9) TaxID=1198114 RepID=E8X1X5_GRATM|nr:NAD(P)H-dependent oxidoreductase [Granulicella tundricola]ADW69136.1 NAD(P)H dehydrogenase (quinone) [Granulicella tundricola MP5ACTX9]
MPTLLHLDSSPAGDASISRHLTAQFVAKWQAANPTGTVITRDITTMQIPPVSQAWIAARMTPADARTTEQKELLTLSDSLIADLKSADEYVFGVPMYNFGIPAILKLWIDQIARPGETFSYVNGTPAGLLTDKKATFVIASGGDYSPETAMASYNYTAPYLKAVFGFLGVTDTLLINAGGAMAVAFGKIDLPTFMQPHIESIHQRIQ